VSRRSLLLLPVLLSALALPVAPALAGEDPTDPPVPAPTPGPVTAPRPATLHVTQGCVSGNRAKVVVTAPGAASVVFYLDGKRIKTVSTSSRGRAVISMRCSRLSVGAHRGRAVVSTAGSTQTLRFQITRARLTSPQFTG
jgi:hypothetical protein